MKVYTDISQSKRLKEILPLESADMAWYTSFAKEGYSIRMLNDTYPLDIIGEEHDEIPAWSLAALLEIISYPTLSQEYGGKWSCMEFPGDEEVEGCETPVDACYEIILNLHEQNLLCLWK